MKNIYVAYSKTRVIIICVIILIYIQRLTLFSYYYFNYCDTRLIDHITPRCYGLKGQVYNFCHYTLTEIITVYKIGLVKKNIWVANSVRNLIKSSSVCTSTQNQSQAKQGQINGLKVIARMRFSCSRKIHGKRSFIGKLRTHFTLRKSHNSFSLLLISVGEWRKLIFLWPEILLLCPPVS